MQDSLHDYFTHIIIIHMSFPVRALFFMFFICILSTTWLEAQQTASFNFSAGSQPVAGWTNVSGDPATAVRTATDPSGITVSSIATANWAPLSGSCAYDGLGASGGTFFPAAVMLNHWFQYSGALANYNAAVPQLLISGLNKDSVYTVKMAGSSTSASNTNPVRYTVAGLTVSGYIDVNNHNNTANGATFINIAPDTAGKIRVYVNTLPTTDVADIGGLQIIRGRTVAPVPVVNFTFPHNMDIIPENGNLVLSATASETGGTISQVQFYHDTVLMGTVSSAPYNYTWLSPNPGNYTLIAKAIDNQGGSASASIRITVESLNYFWSTTGNIATGGDTSFVGTVDSNRLAFRTKNIERMSILPTGNIGIGTITPSAQFHTTGTVRLAGLTNDSTKTRVVVSDTSGNLYYRNAGTLGLTLGDGLGQSGGAITLGDSIPGPGPHSFTSNRYNYLNGHMYSIGGSVNDPVNSPAFRIYNNGDLTSGTTMDLSVNTANQTGLRYYGKLGMLQLGASDRLDTTQNKIVYGSWPSSGLLINSDVPNTIKGRFVNTVFCGNSTNMDSLTFMENNFVTGGGLNFHGSPGQEVLDKSIVNGYWITFNAPVDNSIISGGSHLINNPLSVISIHGYKNKTMDTARGSVIAGGNNLFGGLHQLVMGNYLINRTPMGTTLGNGNVDFTTQSYTGTQGVANTTAIIQYPILAIGNSSVNDGSLRSNALTVLYNGRTQINTTGFSSALTQANVTPKAALEVVSTNSGVLLPKLTTAQRNAIATGDLQNGLLLYNTDSSIFQYYNGSAWTSVGAGAGSSTSWAQTGNSGTNPANNFIGTTDAQRLVFKTNGVENMTILANGAVGIGTPNQPQSDAKLFVKGNVYAMKVRVTQQYWSDYVFKKDYHLPSLTEVEQYIARHQHLPGVLSAGEVNRKGLDLGDNQAVLLKKIEELTLYLIQQHKELDQLKDANQALDAQNKILNDQNKKLDDQSKKLVEQNQQLREQKQQLEEQDRALKLQQERIEKLEKLMEQQHKN